MNKEEVQQVLSGLQKLHGVPESIMNKAADLSTRLELVPSDQFEKWTDGVVNSTAQEEDRHWGFRTQVQELYSDFSQFLSSHKEQYQNNERVTQILQQFTGIVDSYEQVRQ